VHACTRLSFIHTCSCTHTFIPSYLQSKEALLAAKEAELAARADELTGLARRLSDTEISLQAAELELSQQSAERQADIEAALAAEASTQAAIALKDTKLQHLSSQITKVCVGVVAVLCYCYCYCYCFCLAIAYITHITPIIHAAHRGRG
jgi:hypothetical protein